MSVLIYHGCLHQSKAALAPGECSFLVTLMVAEGGEKGEYFMKPKETPFFFVSFAQFVLVAKRFNLFESARIESLESSYKIDLQFLIL